MGVDILIYCRIPFLFTFCILVEEARETKENNRHSLIIIKLLSTNFTLIFQNRPIRTLYLFDIRSDWVFSVYEYKICTQELYDHKA